MRLQNAINLLNRHEQNMKPQQSSIKHAAITTSHCHSLNNKLLDGI